MRIGSITNLHLDHTLQKHSAATTRTCNLKVWAKLYSGGKKEVVVLVNEYYILFCGFTRALKCYE